MLFPAFISTALGLPPLTITYSENSFVTNVVFSLSNDVSTLSTFSTLTSSALMFFASAVVSTSSFTSSVSGKCATVTSSAFSAAMPSDSWSFLNSIDIFTVPSAGWYSISLSVSTVPSSLTGCPMKAIS